MILGLAAQQTLGNLFAGTLLLSAGPFRVGDRVRLQGGPLAGQIEGIASSLGLLYTTFATDEGSILVPNSVVLNVAVYTGAGTLRTYRSVVEEPGAGPDGSPDGSEETARAAPPPPPAGSTRGSPARRARSAAAAGTRSRARPSSSSSIGRLELTAGEIRRDSPAASPPASFGASERKSSSTSPCREQLRAQVRPALA